MSPSLAPHRRALTATLLARVLGVLGARTLALAWWARVARAGSAVPAPVSHDLALAWAAQRQNDPIAIGLFIDYMRGATAARADDPVSAHLQLLCGVSEGQVPTERSQAMDLCSRVIDAAPGASWAHAFRGRGHALDQRYAEARQDLRRALQLAPGSVELACRLADIEAGAPPRDLAMARHLVTSAHRAAGPSAAESSLLAQTAYAVARACVEANPERPDVDARVGGAEEILAVLRIAAQRDPALAEARHLSGRLLVSLGDGQAAREHFAAATRLRGSNEGWLLEYATVLANGGNGREAMAALALFVAAYPRSLPVRLRLAALAHDMGDSSEAVVHWRAVVSLEHEPSTEAMLGLVRALWDCGRPDEIAALDTRNVVPDPGEALWQELHLRMGQACATVGAFARAVEHYARCGPHARAQYHQACAQAHLGHFAEALQLLDEVIGLGGSLAEAAHLQAGHAHVGLGDHRRAMECYAEVAATAGLMVEARTAAACLALVAGDTTTAERWLRDALAHDSTNLDGLLAAGALRELQGRPREALEVYRHIVRGAITAGVVGRACTCGAVAAFEHGFCPHCGAVLPNPSRIVAGGAGSREGEPVFLVDGLRGDILIATVPPEVHVDVVLEVALPRATVPRLPIAIRRGARAPVVTWLPANAGVRSTGRMRVTVHCDHAGAAVRIQGQVETREGEAATVFADPVASELADRIYALALRLGWLGSAAVLAGSAAAVEEIVAAIAGGEFALADARVASLATRVDAVERMQLEREEGATSGRVRALERAAVLAFETGLLDEAEDHLQECARLGLDGDVVTYYRGAVAWHRGQPEETLGAWTALASSRPTDASLQMNLGAARVRSAAAAAERGDIESAIAQLDHARQHGDSTTVEPGLVAGLLFHHACALAREPDSLREAGGYFERAAALVPDHLGYAFACAVHRMDAEPTEACEALARLAGAGDPDGRVRYHLSLALLRAGHTERAVRVLSGLVSSSLANEYGALARIALANEFARAGAYDRTCELLEPLLYLEAPQT